MKRSLPLPILVLAWLASSFPHSASAASAVEPPVGARRGKLLFEETMSKPPSAEWRVTQGKWEAVDGAWVATELPGKSHGPTIRHNLPASDVVIELEFRWNGAKGNHISFNDSVGHVSRVLVEPGSLVVRKDSYEHKNDEELMHLPAKIAPDKWHKLTVELRGQEMRASVDAFTAHGTHPDLAKPKTEFALGFGANGKDQQLRNLRIWEAAPAAGSSAK